MKEKKRIVQDISYLVLNENNVRAIAQAFNSALYKKVFTNNPYYKNGLVASFEIVNDKLYLHVDDAVDRHTLHYVEIPYGAELDQPNDGIAISNANQILTFLVVDKQPVSFLWEENGKDCYLNISLEEGIEYTEARKLITIRRFELA